MEPINKAEPKPASVVKPALEEEKKSERKEVKPAAAKSSFNISKFSKLRDLDDDGNPKSKKE